jgi:hypothetical protein
LQASDIRQSKVDAKQVKEETTNHRTNQAES